MSLPKFSISICLLGCTPAFVLGCSDPPGADGSFGGQTSSPSTGGGAASGGAATTTGGTTGSGGGTGGGSEPVLVWAEEFEGTGLPNTANWSFETQGPGWVNDELQNYTGTRQENVRLENGSLIIEARRDNFDGKEYSSARIHTAGKAEFAQGRFEARAKLPSGRGTWPAIWMMPSNPFKFATTCSAATGWVAGCDAWPNSGEIDFMEHVGYDPGVVHGTIHCQAYNWNQAQQKTAQIEVTDVFETFHLYAVEKRLDRIDIFVDGEKYFSYKKLPGSDWKSWPFDEPFFFILNIAVGGQWGGAQGVDPGIFPQRMEIDYLRVYELVD